MQMQFKIRQFDWLYENKFKNKAEKYSLNSSLLDTDFLIGKHRTGMLLQK